MAEEREQEERPAFDEDPPIDPDEPRVGNSKAVFVEPVDEGRDDEDEAGEEDPGDDEDDAGSG